MACTAVITGVALSYPGPSKLFHSIGVQIMENSIGEVIKSLRSKGSIIVNKNMAMAFGLNIAVLYPELLSKYKYFADREELTQDGYFFNTVENMKDDTSLSDHQQREAIKILVTLKLIDYRVNGMPARRYFRPNLKMFNSFFDVLNSDQFLNNLNTSFQKNAELVLKILDGNNTNTNNTNNNNTKETVLGNPQGGIHRPPINFNSYKEQHQFANTDIPQVIESFLSKYEERTGEEHPKLQVNTWEGISETLLTIEADELNDTLNATEVALMTDHYFIKVADNKYEAEKPTINHFNHPKIKEHNYYEALYHG